MKAVIQTIILSQSNTVSLILFFLLLIFFYRIHPLMNTSRKIRINNNSGYSLYSVPQFIRKKGYCKKFHYVINSTPPLFSFYLKYRAVANSKRKLWVPVIQVYEEISKGFSHNLLQKRGERDLSSCLLEPCWFLQCQHL